MPRYTYYPEATPKSVENEFPAIESGNTTEKVRGGGEVCFATLSNESNYIYATRGRSGLTSGTRFHIVNNEAVTCPCPSEFIDPKWMAENRLLSLPLENQIWVQDKAVEAWIATKGNSAIVTNTSGDQAITTLTHTYVTTIKTYSPGGDAVARIPYGTAANQYTTANAKFQKDLEVPLYYVQNDAGLYLTVVPKSDMSDLNATTPDVNGIKLEWQAKFNYNAAEITAIGYDKRALQLFAISGCKENDGVWYGNNFIYLPLASYEINYATGVIDDDIVYNTNLGKAKATSENCVGNDVTACYRISQYSPVASLVKNLVVFNSSGQAGTGNLVPIEFRLKKQNFVKEFCEFQLVQNSAGKYYTFDNMTNIANDDFAKTNRLDAHWIIEWDDNDLARFKPELKEMYGVAIEQIQLTGEYYFVKKLSGTINDNKTGSVKLQVLNVSGYKDGKYEPEFLELTLSCVEQHTVPFFDLEKDGGLNIFASQLAILEAPYVDRNLTYFVEDENGATPPTPIYRDREIIGYQTYIAKIGENFNNAEYLTVYRENRRELTEHHIIPYYSFSITNKLNGNEYFLNVDSREGSPDSVYWTILTPIEREDLLDYEGKPNALNNFKFCLPYKVDANGALAPKVKYGAASYYPVYLQTLDKDKGDSPSLVISGSSTKYVTCRKLDDAMKPGVTKPTDDWNIFTVDYRYIDEMKVTAWIFGGATPLDNVWVPLLGARELNTTATGVLTNQKLAGGGVTFVTESGADPNYGIMGTTNTNNLTFEFRGETTIGAWAVRPIWYYRIKLADGKYLTDATNKSEAAYKYAFGGASYPYGYFTEALTPKPEYVAQDILADADFVQTFGLQYVDASDNIQSFYVIANANYTNPKNEAGYRFLASINDHLVFVDDPKDAMIFQFGKKDANGYTDLEVVGQGGIFGVEGGVKLLNTSGKVDVYSIDGRLIKSTVLTGGEEFIAVPRGVAVVKNGSKVVKVVVR